MPGFVFQFRRGDRGDAATLADFAAHAYAQAFGHATRPDDLAAYLASNFSEQLQAVELTDPGVITILATSDRILAGYAQVRRHTPPKCVTGRDPAELWRFYVDRPWQGRGLAGPLLRAALSASAELGGRTVWLSVWEGNARAISFYRKNGFRDVGVHPFWVGADRQTDRIMVVEASTPNADRIRRDSQ
jgi:diamine N-acetyltransferase